MNRPLGELLVAPLATRSTASHPRTAPARIPADGASVTALTAAPRSPATKSPLVIGHRGALKSLRATERLPVVRQGNTMYDGRFQIPTFAEILALRERLSTELNLLCRPDHCGRPALHLRHRQRDRPRQSQIIARNPNGTLGHSTALVALAHAAGLQVHAYTFRAENTKIPSTLLPCPS